MIDLGSMDMRGFPLMLRHVVTITVALSLLAVTVATGCALLRRVWRRRIGASAELTLGTALGIGLTSSLLLASSAVVGPHWYVLWAVVALLALATWRQLIRLPGLCRASCGEVIDGLANATGRKLLAGGAATLLATLLVLALIPPTDYDSLNYHLRVPQQWLAHGRIYLPPDNYHTAFVGAAHMLYLPVLSAGLIAAPQVLNAMLTVLLGLATFALAREVAGPRPATIALLMLFASPIIVLSGTLPMVDVTLALMLTSATLALVMAASEGHGRRGIYLAGAMLGTAFGVKYLAIIYAVALVPVGLMAAWRVTGGVVMRTLGVAMSTVAVFLVFASPWLGKNAVLFGNPIFPYLQEPKVEPWLRPLYRDLRPTGVDKAIFSVHREMREPVTFTRLFLHPESLEADVDRHDSAPYLPLILAPLALAFPGRRKVALVLLPALGFGGLVVLYSRVLSVRYLIPMLPGLTIGLAVVCEAALQRLSRLGRSVLVATLVVLAMPLPLALLARVQWKQAIPHALGTVSDDAALRGYWDTADYLDVVRWTDAHILADAPVILLFEGRGFYFHGAVYEDILLRNWAYLAPFAADGSCLSSTGARFIIVNDDGRRYFLSRGVRPDAFQWDKFAAFRDRCLRLRYSNAKFEVFETRASKVSGMG